MRRLSLCGGFGSRQRKNVPDARIAFGCEDFRIGGLHFGDARMVLGPQPWRLRVGHPSNEGMPRLLHPLTEDLGAPFGGALLDLRRRKEEGGARAREVLSAAWRGPLVDVGTANRGAVLELTEARVDR